MTGYQSKRAAAQDKLAHLTFEQRCRLSEQCLPEAPYREMLTKLHDEMLKALAQPAQEPWPEEPFGHMAGGVQPAQEPVAWMSDHDVGFKKSEFGATPTVPLYTTPPQRTEQNFCPRCGKRTADLTTIHTCTPPHTQVKDKHE